MAEIISINEELVKIGLDNGEVLTVPVSCLNYAGAKVGDQVRVYKDGDDYLISYVQTKVQKEQAVPDNYVSMNKHIFVWVFTFLVGGFGVDRFVRGQIGCGVCKLLFNWATFGIWGLVDWIIAIVKAYGTAYGRDEEVVFDATGHYTK